MNQKETIEVVARICYYAQSHSEDWPDRSDLGQAMEHTSFIVACFLTKAIDEAVEWDIAMKKLCGRVLSYDQWEEEVSHFFAVSPSVWD